MISINTYLNQILNDFTMYLNGGHRLCGLKSAHFDQGQLPDYTDIHVQQYYLLRYAYGYAFEYKSMFHILLEQHPFEEEISVTSIGCGAALDYWALVRVLEQRNKAGVSVRYTGMDLIRWNYQFQQRDRDQVVFCEADAVRVLAQCDQLESDIYLFPKSISEFSDGDFKRLCDVFQTTPIKKDKLYLLVSIRVDENNQQRDFQRIKQLGCAIVKNGFRFGRSSGKIYTAQNPEKKIREADPDFRHPGAVIECLKELNVLCRCYQENHEHCQADCQERLTRWPILNQGHACFTIIAFERK